MIGCRPSAYHRKEKVEENSDTFRMECHFWLLEHFAEGMAFRVAKDLSHGNMFKVSKD